MMYGYGYGPMMGYGGAGWFGILLMFLFGVAIIVGLVMLVVWASRRNEMHHGEQPPITPAQARHDQAVAIARERLARGEINTEQYAEIIAALDKK
jgi:putative membrane protein